MAQESRKPTGPDRTAPQLGSCWSLSESYQSVAQRNTANYNQGNQIIFEISTIEKFALLWKHTDYSKPSNLFYDSQNHNIRKFKINESDKEEKVLEGLLLFRKGVNPEWEDPANKTGCSFDCNLKDLEPAQIDSIWQNLLLGLIGESFPFVEYITGIRFLDRLKKHNSIKLEIWLSVSTDGLKQGTEEYFKNNHIVETITEHHAALLNRTFKISVHELTRTDHKIKLKVN